MLGSLKVRNSWMYANDGEIVEEIVFRKLLPSNASLCWSTPARDSRYSVRSADAKMADQDVSLIGGGLCLYCLECSTPEKLTAPNNADREPSASG